MSIPDPIAAVKTAINVGQFIVKRGPCHTLDRVNKDLRDIMPILDDHKDFKSKPELEDLLAQYDEYVELRIDEVFNVTLRANECRNLTVKAKQLIPLMRKTHALKRHTKALSTSAQISSEKARREKLRQFVQYPVACQYSDSTTVTAELPHGSHPPVTRETDNTFRLLRTEEIPSEYVPKRKVTLVVHDRIRTPAQAVDSSSDPCISVPEATERYPTHVQVTTSVSSLERLCPGIAHQLFHPLEDEETLPGARGDLAPLVVCASPLDRGGD